MRKRVSGAHGGRHKHGERDLLKLGERRVALERVRERLGARIADLILVQPVKRKNGSGSVMLVAVGTEHVARDLPEYGERRAALERVRERLGARVADLIPV